MLAHAPALLALGLFGAGRALRWSGTALLLGVVLFSADLIARHYGMARLFPMAAPIGGLLMIGGWLAVALSALLAGTRRT